MTYITKGVYIYKSASDSWMARVVLKDTKFQPTFTLCKIDREYSKEELYVLFFERLEKGSLTTRRGGVLKQDSKGDYFIDDSESIPKGLNLPEILKSGNVRFRYRDINSRVKFLVFKEGIFDTSKGTRDVLHQFIKDPELYVSKSGYYLEMDSENSWRAVKFVSPPTIIGSRTLEQIAQDLGPMRRGHEEVKMETRSFNEVDESKVICDPSDPDIQSLIGKVVLASNSFNFKSAFRARLTGVSRDNFEPFNLECDRRCIFIKKCPAAEYIPYDLDDSNVRDSLRGKWFKDKTNSKECMISSFTFTDGEWRVNGITAKDLVKKYLWMDGSPVGVKIKV